MTWTQAAISRAVKAAIKGYQDATGRVATGTKVTFREGAPIVEVTSSGESVPPAPVNTGGMDEIEALKKRVGRLHRATGRP